MFIQNKAHTQPISVISFVLFVRQKYFEIHCKKFQFLFFFECVNLSGVWNGGLYMIRENLVTMKLDGEVIESILQRVAIRDVSYEHNGTTFFGTLDVDGNTGEEELIWNNGEIWTKTGLKKKNTMEATSQTLW